MVGATGISLAAPLLVKIAIDHGIEDGTTRTRSTWSRSSTSALVLVRPVARAGDRALQRARRRALPRRPARRGLRQAAGALDAVLRGDARRRARLAADRRRPDADDLHAARCSSRSSASCCSSSSRSSILIALSPLLLARDARLRAAARLVVASYGKRSRPAFLALARPRRRHDDVAAGRAHGRARRAVVRAASRSSYAAVPRTARARRCRAWRADLARQHRLLPDDRVRAGASRSRRCSSSAATSSGTGGSPSGRSSRSRSTSSRSSIRSRASATGTASSSPGRAALTKIVVAARDAGRRSLGGIGVAARDGGELRADAVTFAYGDSAPAVADVSLDRRAGRAPRARRRDGRRQVDAREAARRARTTRSTASVSLGGVDLRDATLDALRSPHRLRPAGGPPVLRLDRRQRAARASGSERRRGARGAAGDRRARAVRGAARTGSRPTSARAACASRRASASSSRSRASRSSTPAVIVLDEATSSLDPQTEAAVEHALVGARRTGER